MPAKYRAIFLHFIQRTRSAQEPDNQAMLKRNKQFKNRTDALVQFGNERLLLQYFHRIAQQICMVKTQPFFRNVHLMFIKVPDISKVELQRLIQGCIARNRSSQQELYVLYSASLFSLCLRYCNNREEAEEVLQDGFVQVFTFIHQFKFAGTLEAWMRKIFINCSLQRYRDNERRVKVILLREEFHLQADVAISGRIHEKELIHIIQSLPPAYRMVFNLYVLEGYKHREIAALLNISEGTSKSNLFDARALLKKQLKLEFKLAK